MTSLIYLLLTSSTPSSLICSFLFIHHSFFLFFIHLLLLLLTLVTCLSSIFSLIRYHLLVMSANNPFSQSDRWFLSLICDLYPSLISLTFPFPFNSVVPTHIEGHNLKSERSDWKEVTGFRLLLMDQGFN